MAEYYGLWQGWGAQWSLRFFPDGAFHDFFIDAHVRASDLALVHLLGAGVEVGAEHQLGKSHWIILWSLGGDVGVGGWFASQRLKPLEFTNLMGTWLHEGFVAMPKVRFMLGYAF